MFIRISTFVVTFAVALVGIFLNTHEIGVQIALAALAGASFLLGAFIEIQASRDADFTKRALERLIQASTPSELFAEAVRQIVIGQGIQHELNTCLVTKTSNGESGAGFVWRVIFTDEAGKAVKGYFEFDHELLARWSLLDDSALSEEIAYDMFGRELSPSDDPKDNWNDLVKFIGSVGKGIYPDAGGAVFSMLANTDTVEIGLPYPPGVPPLSGRTKHLKVRGESVPYLVFSRDQLARLAGQSSVAASAILAEWLADAWGPPSVLHN